MLKLLHTADWQIGRQYARFAPEDAAALFEARFSVVERIAAFATAGNYDAVLVAGDVFDAQTVAERSIRRLFNAMQSFKGPWILLPGNHDAALAESVWTRAQRMGVVPDTVHLALEAIPLSFPDVGMVVLPAPLTQRQTPSDLTAWFDHADTDDGLLRVGLAHGSVQGILADTIDSPNPIAPTRADTARLDYLALGDWHGTKQINPRIWYSGTPEPDRFKSNASGQVLSVCLSAVGAVPEVTAHSIGGYQWLSLQEHLALDSDLDKLLATLQQLPTSTVLELNISGHIDLAGQQRLQKGLAAAEAQLRSLHYDDAKLTLHATAEDIAALHADGYLGDVLAELQHPPQADQDEVYADALLMLADILRQIQQGETSP